MENKEIKTLLMSKFVELGGKLDLVERIIDGRYDDNILSHIRNILKGERFDVEMINRHGKGGRKREESLVWRKYLKDLPMGIALVRVELTQKVTMTTTYTKKNKRSAIKKYTYQISDDTSWLKGEAKTLMEAEIREARGWACYKDETKTCKLDQFFEPKIKEEILTKGSYKKEGQWVNSVISIEVPEYILFYKDLFVLITEEEARKLLVDREVEVNKSTIEELKVLDFEKVKELGKDIKPEELKAWLRDELKKMERRLEDIWRR